MSAVLGPVRSKTTPEALLSHSGVEFETDYERRRPIHAAVLLNPAPRVRRYRASRCTERRRAVGRLAFVEGRRGGLIAGPAAPLVSRRAAAETATARATVR